jgi:hypothetical protein
MSKVPQARGPSPVFICGYPKSGTTLLIALLDRHPELLVFPEESKFLTTIMGHPKKLDLDYVLTQTGANAFRFDEVHWPSGYRDYSSIDFAEYKRSLREHWDNGDETEQSLLESVVFSYGEVTGQADRRYWVEKTPHNEQYLDKALTWWPELRAIYIVRDPRDNYCSYRRKRVRDSRSLTLEEFIIGWSVSIQAWERFVAYNANSLLVRYDDLVQFPRTEMQRVCDFLEIDWADILREPTRNGVSWSGNSMHGTKFKGVSTASLRKYRDLLMPDEVSFLETWLARVMVRYGWQIESKPPSLRSVLRELCCGSDGSLVLKVKMMRSLLRVYWPTV